MAVGGDDFHVMADNDAVKTCHGARRVKAFGRLHQSVMVKGKLAECTFVRPLVEVTHHHRGHVSGAGIHSGQ